MKMLLRAVALFLLATITLQADPITEWLWQPTAGYENGEPIDADDTITYHWHCGSTEGGPYPDTALFATQEPPTLQDMAFTVNNQPGTYYCVATALSAKYATESEFSNEDSFTVEPGDLGFVPLPPTIGQ